MTELMQDILTNKYNWLSEDENKNFFDHLVEAGFFDTFNEMLIGNK